MLSSPITAVIMREGHGRPELRAAPAAPPARRADAPAGGRVSGLEFAGGLSSTPINWGGNQFGPIYNEPLALMCEY